MTPASSTARIPGSTVKGLNCPSCGAALQIRGFEHTLTVVCPQCLSILDAKNPNLQVLQKFQAKTRITPLIPLGSRGLWHGTVYEAIGYQQRSTQAGGTVYSWGEYLLFNPYKGFRYFTEYNGHWNDVRTLRALPKPGFALSAKPHVSFAGTSYTHFATAQASTTYVLGEFPWQIRRGESVAAKDYVAPPKIPFVRKPRRRKRCGRLVSMRAAPKSGKRSSSPARRPDRWAYTSTSLIHSSKNPRSYGVSIEYSC